MFNKTTGCGLKNTFYENLNIFESA